MVQVDVREQDGVEIAHADAAGTQLLAESIERGARAGVDNGAVALRFESAAAMERGRPSRDCRAW